MGNRKKLLILMNFVFMHRALAPDTLQTAGNGGVGGKARGRDFFAAVGAIAVFAVVYALEGGVDFLPFGGAASGLRLGHGLILEGIHAGKPPGGLLIEGDGFLGVGGGGVFGVEGCEPGLEDLARVGHVSQMACASSLQPRVYLMPSVMTGRAMRAGWSINCASASDSRIHALRLR